MSCPFCSLDGEPIAANEYAFAIRDAYPVSEGHTLIIPRRHITSYFALSEIEQQHVWTLANKVRSRLAATHSFDSLNVGVNDGEAAGQTVPHCHVHLIPRYAGDVADPRGGVRFVIPDRARYWEDGE